MDPCIPGVSVQDARAFARSRLGVPPEYANKMTVKQICKAMRECGKTSIMPPMDLCDGKYLIDPRSPLSIKEFLSLLTPSSTMEDIVKIAKKLNLMTEYLSKGELKSNIIEIFKDLKISEPIKLPRRVTPKSASNGGSLGGNGNNKGGFGGNGGNGNNKGGFGGNGGGLGGLGGNGNNGGLGGNGGGFGGNKNFKKPNMSRLMNNGSNSNNSSNFNRGGFHAPRMNKLGTNNSNYNTNDFGSSNSNGSSSNNSNSNSNGSNNSNSNGSKNTSEQLRVIRNKTQQASTMLQGIKNKTVGNNSAVNDTVIKTLGVRNPLAATF